MTTTADLLARTRDFLMTGKNDVINELQSNIDGSVSSLALSYPYKMLNPGSTLGIELEEMYVLDMAGASAGNAITVRRAYEGSSAVAHAAGTLVRINPHFSDSKIFKALNATIHALSGEGAFRVKSVSLTGSASTNSYDFAADDWIGSYRLRFDTPGSANDWPIFNASDYYVDVTPDGSEFPSGRQLVLRAGVSSGRTVRYSYKARFGPLAGLADDVEVVSGVHAQGHELLAIGAAIRLLSGRDIKRTFLVMQPEPRRQEEVPAGAAQQSMGALVNMYREERNNYMRYLHRLYPAQVR